MNFSSRFLLPVLKTKKLKAQIFKCRFRVLKKLTGTLWPFMRVKNVWEAVHTRYQRASRVIQSQVHGSSNVTACDRISLPQSICKCTSMELFYYTNKEIPSCTAYAELIVKNVLSTAFHRVVLTPKLTEFSNFLRESGDFLHGYHRSYLYTLLYSLYL